MRKLCLGVGLLCLNCISFAQNGSFEYTDTSIIDSEIYNTEDGDIFVLPDTNLVKSPVVNFSDSVHTWKNDSDYKYVSALDSVLKARKQKADLQNREDAVDNQGNFFSDLLNSKIFQFLLWAIALAALGYILFKFFSNSDFRRLRRKKRIPVEALPDDDLPAPGSFLQIIQDAVRNADYRLAVRYQFLQSLSLLSEKHLIEFATDKTNAEYKRELPERLQKEFRQLVLHYEYCWYGKLNLTEAQYRNVENLYHQFNQQI